MLGDDLFKAGQSLFLCNLQYKIKSAQVEAQVKVLLGCPKLALLVEETGARSLSDLFLHGHRIAFPAGKLIADIFRTERILIGGILAGISHAHQRNQRRALSLNIADNGVGIHKTSRDNLQGISCLYDPLGPRTGGVDHGSVAEF